MMVIFINKLRKNMTEEKQNSPGLRYYDDGQKIGEFNVDELNDPCDQDDVLTLFGKAISNLYVAFSKDSKEIKEEAYNLAYKCIVKMSDKEVIRVLTGGFKIEVITDSTSKEMIMDGARPDEIQELVSDLKLDRANYIVLARELYDKYKKDQKCKTSLLIAVLFGNSTAEHDLLIELKEKGLDNTNFYQKLAEKLEPYQAPALIEKQTKVVSLERKIENGENGLPHADQFQTKRNLWEARCQRDAEGKTQTEKRQQPEQSNDICIVM